VAPAGASRDDRRPNHPARAARWGEGTEVAPLVRPAAGAQPERSRQPHARARSAAAGASSGRGPRARVSRRAVRARRVGCRGHGSRRERRACGETLPSTAASMRYRFGVERETIAGHAREAVRPSTCRRRTSPRTPAGVAGRAAAVALRYVRIRGPRRRLDSATADDRDAHATGARLPRPRRRLHARPRGARPPSPAPRGQRT
jgi:hypothetical protein